MPQDINFLSQQQKIAQARSQTDRRSYVYIAIIAAITAVVYAGVWLTSAYYQKQVKAANQQLEKAKADLVSNLPDANQYLAFVDRLNTLTDLLEKRDNGMSTLDTMYNYSLTRLTGISKLSYDYYTRMYTVEFLANSAFSFAKLLTMLQDPKFTKPFKSFYITSLTRDSDGIYRLVTEMEI